MTRRGWPRRLRIFAFLTALFGCTDAFAPPPGTYRFVAPAVYDTLWADVQTCSGLSGNLERIAWLAVPVATFPCADGQECAGLWRSPHSIYLTEWVAGLGQSGPSRRDQFIGDPFTGDEFVIRHEMLHDLLGGGEDHPSVFEACGLLRR